MRNTNGFVLIHLLKMIWFFFCCIQNCLEKGFSSLYMTTKQGSHLLQRNTTFKIQPPTINPHKCFKNRINPFNDGYNNVDQRNVKFPAFRIFITYWSIKYYHLNIYPWIKRANFFELRNNFLLLLTKSCASFTKCVLLQKKLS